MDYINNEMIELIRQPWPWYVAGLLIGLTVPALLLLGNKHFGISANLRHLCAACLPANVSFFKYDWKKEIWNLFFVAGILIGGAIAAVWLSSAGSVTVNPNLASELAGYGVTDYTNLVPTELFSFSSLLTARGFILMVVGGFVVGFGARYAGGCTSGHAIMGLSTLQWPSLVATISFMAGGFIMANLILPYIMNL
jgi:uncharacterized membrane protein YedE/YeeE